MSKVRDIVYGSLRKLGVLASGEAASANEAADALSTLNNILDGWSIESLIVNAKIREEFALIPNQSLYTMGPGGNFNTTRPQMIEEAMVKETVSGQSSELPIDIINLDEWARIIVKTTQSSLPLKLFAEGAFPLERINIWPIPTVANSLVLWSWKPLTAFSSIDDDVSLPPAYEKALIYNLAVELAPEYGKLPDQLVMAIAADSKGNIKRMNTKPLLLDCDAGLLARTKSFNWLRGD